MLFHAGSLWRLLELGILSGIDTLSAVSGGSITAALLGLRWERASGSLDAYRREVVHPLCELARRTVDLEAVLLGSITPGLASERLVAALEDALFGDATIQDLPDGPSVLLNSVNVQLGEAWVFSRKRMGDRQLGFADAPRVPLAVAVAASSAFPPFLSPLVVPLDGYEFRGGTDDRPAEPEYSESVYLTDGGTADNLGMDAVWDDHSTLFASDAAFSPGPQARPGTDWARHGLRVLQLILDDMRQNRVERFLEALALRHHLDQRSAERHDDLYRLATRAGAVWSVQGRGAQVVLPCSADGIDQLASLPPKLDGLEPEVQQRLINWGYASCDAGLRTYYDPELAPPGGFPYPDAKV